MGEGSGREHHQGASPGSIETITFVRRRHHQHATIRPHALHSRSHDTLATNNARSQDNETKMFYEIVIAPGYTPDGLEVLKGKSKNLRILEAQPRAPSGLSLRQVGEEAGGQERGGRRAGGRGAYTRDSRRGLYDDEAGSGGRRRTPLTGSAALPLLPGVCAARRLPSTQPPPNHLPTT